MLINTLFKIFLKIQNYLCTKLPVYLHSYNRNVAVSFRTGYNILLFPEIHYWLRQIGAG